MTRRQILVLEEEPSDADDIQTALQNHGFAPAIVSSGPEAIQTAESLKPDLMLVDSTGASPGNRFEVVSEIRSHLDIPIVFLMPYGDEDALARAVELAKTADPDGFVLKPCHERQLVETVEQVLADHTRARKRAQARTQLLAMAETTPDFVATADVEGNIFYLNPAARHILGMDEGEPLSGLHFADIHPTWANVILLGDGIETAMLDGVWHGETALLTRSGHEIPVSQVILAHTATDGHCEFLSIIARDISELKQTEETLRQSEQFYRRIVETANVGMWLVDVDNRIRFANPKMARLLGYIPDEMMGVPLSQFMDTAPLLAAQTSACAEKTEGCQVTLRAKDGSEISAVISTSAMFDQNERYSGVLVVVYEKEPEPATA